MPQYNRIERHKSLQHRPSVERGTPNGRNLDGQLDLSLPNRYRTTWPAQAITCEEQRAFRRPLLRKRLCAIKRLKAARWHVIKEGWLSDTRMQMFVDLDRLFFNGYLSNSIKIGLEE